MTLISAFRGGDGWAIGADSEENAGAFRRSVQKIEPCKVGDTQVIVAGSGTGALVDSFALHVSRLSAEKIADPTKFTGIIEGELVNFYTRDVATYPFEEGEEKEQKFIIAAQWPRTTRSDSPGKEFQSCGAWVTKHCTLSPIEHFELAGFEDVVYQHVAERLFRDDGMRMPQSILAAIYVLLIGTKTSSYIREPIQVAIVRPNGIWMEKQAYIEEVKKRLEIYEESLNKVFLACADTSVSVTRLEKILGDFTQASLELHREHIDKVTGELTIFDALDQFRGQSAYYKYPPDSGLTVYANGRVGVDHDKTSNEHDRARIAELMRGMEQILTALKRLASQKSKDQQ